MRKRFEAVREREGERERERERKRKRKREREWGQDYYGEMNRKVNSD